MVNKAQAYTVTRLATGTDETGLTAVEAAQFMLRYDGHVVELRPEPDGGYFVWRSLLGGGGNLPMVRMLLYSAADDEATAWEEIAHRVLHGAFALGFEVLKDDQ